MPITSRFASAAARAYGMFSNLARAVDPFFNYVTALLHGDGTNGAQNNTFLDSSTNNFTITRNGNTTQGTFSPFSQTGWSNYFDGSGDYLSVASATALNLSTGDFTIECWVYPITGIADVDGVISKRSQSTFTGGDWRIAYRSASTAFGIACGTNNTDRLTPAIALNQWNHIAFVRSSGTLSCYANGLRGDSLTWTDNLDNVSNLLIGLNAAGYDFPGYISNVRIVKSTAVYSGATYTVPTAPLTAITNTSLLTCQANRFLDASSNNFTVTPTGDTSVQAFSPFNPTSAWSASSNGGSGYFDGSGDYLTVAANTAFDVSASAYTFETWVYFTTAPSVTIMFGLNGTGISGYANLLYSGGTLYWQQRGTSTNQTTYTWSPTLGQWYHIAIGWNGSNSLAMWINGTRVATNTVSPTGAGQNGINFGAASDGYAVGGYMSNFRLVKGTDVYGVGNATITVPTAPLTAISNTSFLLNFTNAGIYDNAAVGDYETVGNAQVSTSVVKYGTGSMAFDGTGDWLTAPAQQAFSFGSGDWTVEFWLYTAQTTEALLVANRSGTGATNTNWYIFKAATTNQITLYVSDGSAWQISNLTGGPSVSNSTWYHIAVCRIGSTFKIYVNGTQAATGTWSGAIPATLRPLMVGSDYSGATTLNGYIDDLRITKGIARYPYNFTPPTAAFPNIGGTVTPTSDQYFNYTTLLLPGNGTNGAQNNTFLDSSSNAFTITRNGNTTQGNFSPFSQTGWGNYFDGSGDYVSFGSNANTNPAASDFTVEAWVYPLAYNSYGPVFSNDINNGFIFGKLASGFGIRQFGVGDVIFTATTPSLNQWTHVAATRSGTSWYLFYNGTIVATATASNSFTQGTACVGGDASTATEAWNGYLSNVRFIKGTALYTSNFTPGTTPLTAVTNTQLLTCQSNRFVDNSSNAYAVTIGGTPSVQAFSPFAPTAAWSSSTNGGSGYFDGSGDYLDIASTAALTPSGDFTIEFWAYPTTNAGIREWYSKGLGIQVYSNGAAWYAALSASNSGTYYINTTFGTLLANTWQHVVVTRSGNSYVGFVNGVSSSLATTSSSPSTGTDPVRIGDLSVSAVYPVLGYMSGVRYVNGTAVYGTSNFTPPTSPLTAIANTQLLLNYTNGAITDATAKNDLETVGNAQISTTQSKFGGSSMYFDGTGDSLVAQSNQGLVLGSGDFTIEMWAYYAGASYSGIQYLIDQRTSEPQIAISFYFNGSNLEFYVNGLARISNAVPAAVQTWQHIALVRYSGTTKIYVNGSATGSSYTDSNVYVAPKTTIGDRYSGSYVLNGYIDDLRVTKGIARYTSNFTPPTSAFLTL